MNEMHLNKTWLNCDEAALYLGKTKECIVALSEQGNAG